MCITISHAKMHAYFCRRIPISSYPHILTFKILLCPHLCIVSYPCPLYVSMLHSPRPSYHGNTRVIWKRLTFFILLVCLYEYINHNMVLNSIQHMVYVRKTWRNKISAYALCKEGIKPPVQGMWINYIEQDSQCI